MWSRARPFYCSQITCLKRGSPDSIRSIVDVRGGSTNNTINHILEHSLQNVDMNSKVLAMSAHLLHSIQPRPHAQMRNRCCSLTGCSLTVEPQTKIIYNYIMYKKYVQGFPSRLCMYDQEGGIVSLSTQIIAGWFSWRSLSWIPNDWG